MDKEALDIPDILKDDNSDVSMPGSSQEEVRVVDRFQDANAGSLDVSRRINKRQRAKDKNQMARVCDAMAKAKALEVGALHPRTLQELGEVRQAPLKQGDRLSCKDALFVKVGELCEMHAKTFVCNNMKTNASKNVDRAVVCKCHDKECAFSVN